MLCVFFDEFLFSMDKYLWFMSDARIYVVVAVVEALQEFWQMKAGRSDSDLRKVVFSLKLHRSC